MLEVSEENKKYLLNLIYKMFMAGTKDTIKKEEWKNLHKDYKSIIDGVHYVLKGAENGTCLVPVVVLQKGVKMKVYILFKIFVEEVK